MANAATLCPITICRGIAVDNLFCNFGLHVKASAECIHAEGVKILNQDKRYSNKYFGNLLKKKQSSISFSLSLDCNINPEDGDDDILQCLQNGKRTAGFKGH